MTTQPTGPVVFAYDGSELAKLAIEQTGALLSGDRDALVVCVWQPFDVGFVPVPGLQFNSAQATDVRQAAERTAEQGASHAQSAGFRAHSIAVESAPTWKGIVDIADERDASLIVLGSHGRTGLASVVIGSVAGAVAQHSRRSVLIIHRPAIR
jgi:nucleotide-binding universal stress UspA family protein